MIDDKPLIMNPDTLLKKKRKKKGPKKPRPRCPICDSTAYASRIDKERPKNTTRKRGRPIKNAQTTRHTRIGYWCEECEIFYYPCGTPNYKQRLKQRSRNS